jgi:PAS domain S-box-containing protein
MDKDEELARLTDENRRLTTLLDSIDDVLILLGPDERLLYVNGEGRRQTAAMTGRSISEHIGKMIDEMNMPASMLVQAKSLRANAIRGEAFTGEILVPLPGGARWNEQKVRPVKNKDGQLEGFAMTSRDVHDRVLARERLAQALAVREQVIGILGHDLRNPLSAIEGLSTLTLRRTDLPSEVHARLEQIERAAKRTLEMIETLLDFTESRFRRTFKISRVPTDLPALCRAAVAELCAAYPNRTVELVVEGDGQAACDPARVAQVVSNLVTNALIHGSKDGTVQLKVEGLAGHVALEVTNQGEPIPDDLMGVLFEPFRRRPEALDRPRGLGLGLYIAQQIISAHGGNISVTSSSDSGTCFTVSIPRSAVEDVSGQSGTS